MSRINIGGQAVMEGVMMRNNDRYAVAVRKPDKQIEVKTNRCTGTSDRPAVCNLPIVRGVFSFVQSLTIGVKTLMYSAQFFEDEEEEAPKKEKKKKKEKTKEQESRAEKAEMAGTVTFSIVLAVGLFMLLPAWIASLLDAVIKSHVLIGLIEGVIRLAIFLGYVIAISRMEDIKRTYMYHGAEHKCINCIERGRALSVRNVRKSSRYHARCGTSFLFIVMVISIIFFIFIRVESPVARVVVRVLLVPVIAGVAYEFIRLAGRSNNIVMRILSLPGKGMQMLTTKEPDDDMIEVAIAAVEAVFDWRAFQGLKEEEPLEEPELEPDMPKLESGQTDAPELEELDEIKIEDL